MILVLFDIDGTLMLSRGLGRVIIQDALSDIVGRRVSASGVAFSGRTDPAIAIDMLRLAGLSPEEVTEHVPACLQAYAAALTERLNGDLVDVLPGVRALVEQLHQDPDVQLGLLTGNLHVTAEIKLRAARLDRFFPFGAYGSDDADRYALPAVALARAKQHTGRAFTPARSVIIGDTEHDVACGQRAGMRTVAVCTGRYGREALALHDPDLLLDDLSDPAPLLSFLAN